VGMLDKSGKITNPKKCLTDLKNRESKASTALGSGIALPHVRTPQAKGFCMAIAVAPDPGLYFDAIDEAPVRLFIPMVAPAYDDKFYLKVERALAGAFADGDEFRDAILAATTPGEVIHLLSGIID
jgi:mannitol/fructose-specific phosphotransferase system IIA component (Ntr-type)